MPKVNACGPRLDALLTPATAPIPLSYAPVATPSLDAGVYEFYLF